MNSNPNGQQAPAVSRRGHLDCFSVWTTPLISRRPFWGRIAVEGWDHSLNYCLLPLPVGSRLRPAFAMWQCFQGSRPGCGRGNDDSDMGQKVPPPTWPVATPMSRACAGAHGRHGRTVQSPSHSTRVQPRQGNPDVPADTPVPEGQS